MSGEFILALDPGTRNLGWAIIDFNTQELCYSGVCDIKRGTGDVALATNVINFACSLPKLPFRTICIESQNLSMTMRGVQQALVTAFLMLGFPDVRIIYAQTIKSHFRSRGLSCRGNRQNKIDAIATVKAMGYSKCSSHEADAILMCLYISETENQFSN